MQFPDSLRFVNNPNIALLQLCGESREKEEHIKSYDCPVYSDIRAEFTKDLVAYFNRVLERRDKITTIEQDKRDFYG